MSEAMHWIELVISSGLLIAVIKLVMATGKLLERVDGHEKRLDSLENRLNFPRGLGAHH